MYDYLTDTAMKPFSPLFVALATLYRGYCGL